jgi:hypothetical protein
MPGYCLDEGGSILIRSITCFIRYHAQTGSGVQSTYFAFITTFMNGLKQSKRETHHLSPSSAKIWKAYRLPPPPPPCTFRSPLATQQCLSKWRSKVRLQNLTNLQSCLVEKLPILYLTNRFVTVFMTFRNWTLSWPIWLQSASSHPVFKVLFSINLWSAPRIPKQSFALSFTTNLRVYRSSMHATCPDTCSCFVWLSKLLFREYNVH